MTNPNDEITMGGEPIQRKVLPLLNDDGTPALYPVEVKSFSKRQSPKPNERGEATFYYLWILEVMSGEFRGETLMCITNMEARNAYTGDKKPMKLLQFITAILGKAETAKLLDGRSKLSLSSLIGKTLRVELDEKPNSDGTVFQKVVRYYPLLGKIEKVEEQEAPEEETIDLDADTEEVPF